MSHGPPPRQDAWSILALLEWTTRFFENKGIESARLDAELLLAHALGCRRIDLYARYDEVPCGEPLDGFREMVRARGRRVPAKYLVGECEFYSMALAVDPRVLIPRPETELLVERALEVLAEGEDLLAADLGTGSGAIAVALAARRPQVRVVATDVSAEALEVARANAQRHGLAERIVLRRGSWFDALADEGPFDAVVSNPPYVASAELDAAMPEVRDHEPRLALDGGPDGLAALGALVAGAPAWLRPGAWLVVEVGAGQAAKVAEQARTTGHYETIQVAPDYQGIDRIVSLRNKSSQQSAPLTSEV